jgi:hypothetical protein
VAARRGFSFLRMTIKDRRRIAGKEPCSLLMFLYSLFLCCLHLTFNPRSDALLLPICDFVFEPPDGALPERHRCGKPAVEDVFVNLTAFFASDSLDFWEPKNTPQASRLHGGYGPLTRFGNALAPALGLALSLSQNFTR